MEVIRFSRIFIFVTLVTLFTFIFGCSTELTPSPSIEPQVHQTAEVERIIVETDKTPPPSTEPLIEQAPDIEKSIDVTVAVPVIEVADVSVEVTVLPTETLAPTVAISPTIETQEKPVYWTYRADLNPVTFETTWTASSESILGTMPNGQPYEMKLTCNAWTVDFGEQFANASTRYVDLGERYFKMDVDGGVLGYTESIIHGWLPLGTQLATFAIDFDGDFVQEFIGNRLNNPTFNAMALSITSPITGLPLVGWWRTDDFQATYDSMNENCKRAEILPTPIPTVVPSPTPPSTPSPTSSPTPADADATIVQAILDNMPSWAVDWYYSDGGDVVYVGPGELSVGLSRTVATSVVLDMSAGAICTMDTYSSGHPLVCEFPDRVPLTLHFGPDGLTRWEDGAPAHELTVGLTESLALNALGAMWKGSVSCSRTGGPTAPLVCQNGDQTKTVTLKFDSEGKLVSW